MRFKGRKSAFRKEGKPTARGEQASRRLQKEVEGRRIPGTELKGLGRGLEISRLTEEHRAGNDFSVIGVGSRSAGMSEGEGRDGRVSGEGRVASQRWSISNKGTLCFKTRFILRETKSWG